jgi:RNA polymerase sigma-70 factor (ECF subfamily)
MGKRIVRAKRKIAEAHIPYRVPGADELPERLGGVLNVIYLVFNEGYSASAGEELVRADLTRQALRLARLVCDLMGEEPEAWALLSLLLLTDARRDARVDEHGRFVALEDQDRSRWDVAQLEEGLSALDRAARGGRRGRYLLQAAVAALHCSPRGEIPWPEIARLHEALWAIDPSPVVALNRAAAAAFAWGPQTGLELLRPLLDDPRLARYQPLHATAAELLARSGDAAGARDALRRAIGLTDNAVERAELERRLAALRPGPG